MSCLSVNKVFLAGRVTKDIEVKQTTSGIAMASFNVAVNRPVKKGEEQKTDFVPVVAYRDKAEFIGRYFSKGSAIWIEGRILTGKYEDKNGVSRNSFSVVVDRTDFIDSKKDLTQSSITASLNVPEEAAENFDADDFEEILSDDGVPF